MNPESGHATRCLVPVRSRARLVPVCLLAVVASGFTGDNRFSTSVIPGSASPQTVALAQTAPGHDPVPANAVFVRGSNAFVAVGSRLVIVDISDRTRPAVIGQTRALPDPIEDVAVAGTIAYVTSGDSGLWVIDVSNPSSPSVLGIYDSPGAASGVHVDGTHAYLADSWAGLQVVDVSDPTAPTVVGQVHTAGRALAVDVAGNHAYVAADEGGLRIIDVSDPTSPAQVGSYAAAGDVNDVAVVKDVAYLAAGGGGLEVVDVTRPSSPKRVGGHPQSYGKSICVSRGHAYLATERSGLWISEVSGSADPVVVSHFDTTQSANDVYVDGDYAFVVTGRPGLRVIDVSNPAAPVALDQ